jgi:hypothetical protein
MYKQAHSMMGRSLLALGIVTILSVVACGDDDPGDDSPVIGTGRAGSNSGGRSGAPAGGAAGNGNEGGTGNVSGADNSGGTSAAGSANEGGSGQGGEGGARDCVDDPVESEEFLNRCTQSRCAAFDNFARIEGFTGELPEL